MPEESREDKDDILTENLNTVIFLFLGILSITVSVIIFVYTASVALYSQQLFMDFFNRSVVAAVFFVVGFGSFHIFRKRRESRKRKNSAIF